MTNAPAQRALRCLAANPWAMQPDWLPTLAEIAARDHTPDFEAVLARRGKQLNGTERVRLRGNVAILEISGPIFRYANLFSEISGATSIELLATDLRAALDNPAVKRIVLAIDSPGGQTNGVQEFADMVYAARARKPITAYVNELGASAAYFIAAAASEVVLAPMAAVGSIGVVATVRTDKAKDTIEIVSSQSPHKRPDLHTDEGLARLQAHVDALAAVFVERVASYRGLAVESVLADFGQGGVLIGQAAVDAGMADRLGSLEAVIAGVGSTTGPTQETPMTKVERAGRRDGSRDHDQATLEAEWRRDAGVRAEFLDDFESFVAYSKAMSNGQVRIMGRKVTS